MMNFIKYGKKIVKEQVVVTGDTYISRAELIEALKMANLICDNCVATKEMLFDNLRELKANTTEYVRVFRKIEEVAVENHKVQRDYRAILDKLKNLG